MDRKPVLLWVEGRLSIILKACLFFESRMIQHFAGLSKDGLMQRRVRREQAVKKKYPCDGQDDPSAAENRKFVSGCPSRAKLGRVTAEVAEGREKGIEYDFKISACFWSYQQVYTFNFILSFSTISAVTFE